MTAAVFAWEAILTHLSANAVVCRGILGTGVITIGSGPLNKIELDELLRTCGVSIAVVSDPGPHVVILGHENWDAEQLDEVVRACKGGTLRAYSHEMLLASLALGADVFDLLAPEELVLFGIGHSALEHLMDGMGFDWPTTEVIPQSDRLVVDFGDGDWPETGVLKHMGYTVGHHGLVESERRAALETVYAVELVPGSDGADWYIEQWGEPRTARRLQKLANCLASFANTKRRSQTRDYSEAIADWESDLAYLKATYYRPRTGFAWPDTDVLEEPATTAARMATGMVKWFSEVRCYGFISRADGDELFVHSSEIRDEGVKTLDKGQMVAFDVTEGPNGKEQASNVRRV